MKSRTHIFITLLCVAALLNWSEQLLRTGWLAYLSKPLLVPPLFFYLRSGTRSTSLRNGMLLGLGFSWLGDILLLFEEKHALFFATGLASFLVAHLSYAVSFGRYAKRQGGGDMPNLLISLGLLAVGIMVYVLLLPALGALRVPVALYVLAILAMSLTARQVQEQQKGAAGRLLFGGALLFMLSDSLLATAKFLGDFPLSGLLVMLSYVLAQTLLTAGTRRLVVRKNSDP